MRAADRASETARTAPGVSTAAAARAYAQSVVRARWDAESRTVREDDVIDLTLVVSELVTNAIRHGGGLAGFDVEAMPDGVRLAVHDHSDVIPEVAYGSGVLPADHHGNGYGWPLIIRLARDIAIDRRAEGGKTIRVFVPLRDVSG
ncbi:ATP-binding protein [Streptomyces sp. NPDC003011]